MSENGYTGPNHFLSVKDYTRDGLETILHHIEILDLYSGGGNKLNILSGYILDPVFFEHSTRTLHSTIAAMITMGGDYLPPLMEIYSSRMKGESKLDTLVALSQDCDIIAIRDKDQETMDEYTKLPKEHNLVPLVNCGSGSKGHPTQCITDLRTIKKYLDTLDDLVVLIAGDLKYGRVPHSLIQGLNKFSNNKIVGFPVKDLGLTHEYRTNGYEEHDISKLPEFVAKEIHPKTKTVVYITRIQWERIAHERHSNFDQFDQEKKEYIRKQIQLNEYFYEITPEIMNNTPENTIGLHALPRGPELSDELFLYSLNPKLKPVNQMRASIATRMGILGHSLEKQSEIDELEDRTKSKN
jgi:aspartate carbamoyltransferase catalytic subunit